MANGDSEGTGLLTAKDAVLAGLARYLTCIGLAGLGALEGEVRGGVCREGNPGRERQALATHAPGCLLCSHPHPPMYNV